jgi:hypothetical protein
MNPVGPPIHFLNVAYFFQLIYDLFFGVHLPSTSSLSDILSTFWLFFTLVAYLVAFVLIGLLVYYSTRYHQVVEEDSKRYQTVTKDEADTQLEHSRWTYIKELIESPQQSDWRQAIIEADIMLEELLTKLGLFGSSIGDKLKNANPKNFQTLNDAWEAHKVRNEIAHRGSGYQLSDHIAYRTINHYENVFREFNEI